MQNKTKLCVGAIGGILAVSIGGVQWTQEREGTVLKPYYDSGRVATVGTGTTVYPNGQKVKITDPPITKKQATEFLQYHMKGDSTVLNQSLKGVKLSQDEYDVYADFVYQYGRNTWLRSSMLRNLKQAKYVQACNSLLLYKYITKHGKKVDCSIATNKCSGVWKWQVKRNKKCLEAQ
ncbi:hypothetical protein F959_01693 [Acinetobacter venetianus RAG-1 = CIP 110063]|uniref:Lysozyme n=1 Tax=Acinetobacter venetianus (strain ATCC 31012 / DSM 23050 / BCRC 14357 / CCUG 45561 / CIP 110063 / KCTC 2702 / LMG 19082 / RAG-1) TaxID=1191460 RepID=N8YJK5_ACIVR|nr:glycoside hydrolase family protein [Acinetobacter venetianus]ENV36886.1 hypothetical protein F959_01693 [Acinetobacter venetianus RAG-1 = CIP 110063]